MVHMQYAITKIKNGCHLAILTRISPKIDMNLRTAVIHNPTRLYENRLKTFHAILLRIKRTLAKHFVLGGGRPNYE